MPTIRELLRELEQEGEATRRVLERLPEDRLDWRPHERSQTLGQLALHIANIPGAIAEISTRPFDVNTPIPRPEPRSRAEVLEALERSLARARAVLSETDDAALELPWRMMDGEREVGSIPRGDFLRSTMLNHWYHHRGQLTVYYRETGTPVPAIYGDSADERFMPG